MKSNKNISNISESAEDSGVLLLALKSALNPENLISDDLWFNWSKRLAEFPFSSELVCKVASKNHLPWPAAKEFATFDDYLGMPLKKISKMLGRKSQRTLLLCVANAALNILPEYEPVRTEVSDVTRDVTLEEFYKLEDTVDLISSETWDEWTELLLESSDRTRFISDIVDELGSLYWQARWKSEKISDYCRFSLDKIREINTPGKNRTIVICVAKAATDAIAKQNSGDRKNARPITINIPRPVLPETPASGNAQSNDTISASTDLNGNFPKQLLLSSHSTDFHSNFDRIIIDNLSTQPKRPDPDSFWIPQGQTITIGCYSCYSISDGFVYVGSNLKSVHGKSKEPSLIDDSLAIGGVPDHRGKYLSSNSYSRIYDRCRAAYLIWLSTGRKDPKAYIGYVLLFFYGLERRVLADTKDSAYARSEVPAIFSEVKRLLSIYGEEVSFHKYAVKFLDFIFKIALSQNSNGSFSLYADWALACAENDLSMPRRMSVQRCPDEFRELCKIRYNEKFGDGVTLLPNKKCVRATYAPASLSFRGLVELPDQYLPDIAEISELSSQISIMVTNCADELEAYSSYLAKKPHDRDSIGAISYLPVTLLKKQFGAELQLLIKRVEEHISPVDMVSLPFSSLLPNISPINLNDLGGEDVADFASLLGRFNVGIEPDPRFVNFIPGPEQNVILFKIAENAPSSASTEYSAATTILHLAFAVAGGAFNVNEERHVEEYIETWIQHLSANEKTRLRLHYQWLKFSLPDLDCLINKRIKLLIHPNQKESLGRFLVGVANSNGNIDSDKLKILKQIYEILSLNTRSLYNQTRSAVSQPVTIQAADAGIQRGFTIPAPPRPEENFTLDMDSIEEKIAETKAVSAILNNIFSDEEQTSVLKSLTELPTLPVSSIGLDADAFTFMQVLASKLVWGREELETLAAEHNLMLDGTLDSINDASYGHFGSPFFDGEDPIEIDPVIMNKMLSV